MKINFTLFRILFWLALLIIGFSLIPITTAQEPEEISPKLVLGTDSVHSEVEQAILQALTNAKNVLPPTEYYAVANVHQMEDWLFISMVGLAGLGPDLTWSLEKNSIWMGLVLLRQDESGHWAGAASGTIEFSHLIDAVPEKILSTQAKRDLDPLGRISIAATPYLRFPWPIGTKMQYGMSAVHNAGFAGYPGMSGWKAVDFFSNGDIGTGNADRLIVAEAGTIAWVCNDGTSVAVRVGDLLYAHLLNNGNLYTGHYFNQGDEIGVPKMGNFNSTCGYAIQDSAWFHVHLGFPDTGTVQFENWTLNLSDGKWRRNTETLGIYSWFYSEYDSTPTTTTITLTDTGGVGGWYRTNVQITLVSVDNPGGSGVALIQYRLDGGGWQNYSGPFTLSTEGQHTVSYRAQDNAGNWESEKQTPVHIDKTAPTGSLAISNNASVTYASLVYLNPTASDGLSGVSQVHFRDFGGSWSSWQPVTSAALWQLPVATGQTATVEVQFQDRAGNVSGVYSDNMLLNIYPARPASVGYRLTRSTWGVSGGLASSANYRLGGTWGQPSAVSGMSGGSYRSAWGYWNTIGGGISNVYLPLIMN